MYKYIENEALLDIAIAVALTKMDIYGNINAFIVGNSKGFPFMMDILDGDRDHVNYVNLTILQNQLKIHGSTSYIYVHSLEIVDKFDIHKESVKGVGFFLSTSDGYMKDKIFHINKDGKLVEIEEYGDIVNEVLRDAFIFNDNLIPEKIKYLSPLIEKTQHIMNLIVQQVPYRCLIKKWQSLSDLPKTNKQAQVIRFEFIFKLLQQELLAKIDEVLEKYEGVCH